MSQKIKSLFVACLFVLLFGFPGIGGAAVAISAIDFYLTESDRLPDGYDNYGKIELSETACAGYKGVQITVTPNHDFFIEGNNFGIQAFSLNVQGDPDDITFSVPAGWVDLKLQGRNRSEFGVFIVDFDGRGYSRQDPLVITACAEGSDLAIDDFIVANDKGYLFAAHIADFYLESFVTAYQTDEEEEYEGQSAWFATRGTPTFAEEISFTASAGDGAATLQWTAVSEQDVLGYNIYRARGIFGKFEKINEHMIYATGSPSTTAAYEYRDYVLRAGLYAYRLVEIGTDGSTKAYGPVSVFLPPSFF